MIPCRINFSLTAWNHLPSIASQHAVQNGGVAIDTSDKMYSTILHKNYSIVLNEIKNSELATPYLNTKLFPALWAWFPSCHLPLVYICVMLQFFQLAFYTITCHIPSLWSQLTAQPKTSCSKRPNSSGLPCSPILLRSGNLKCSVSWPISWHKEEKCIKNWWKKKSDSQLHWIWGHFIWRNS